MTQQRKQLFDEKARRRKMNEEMSGQTIIIDTEEKLQWYFKIILWIMPCDI